MENLDRELADALRRYRLADSPIGPAGGRNQMPQGVSGYTEKVSTPGHRGHGDLRYLGGQFGHGKSGKAHRRSHQGAILSRTELKWLIYFMLIWFTIMRVVLSLE